MKEIKTIRPCKECVNYKTGACVGEEKRMMCIEDYDFDCFMTKEDKMLCDLMCGGPEDDV